MNKKEVALRTDLSFEDSQKLADDLNEFFKGSHYHAEVESEDVESMSGYKTTINTIRLVDDSKKYYFTFGSSEQFPYQYGYLIVCADSKSEAVGKYRAKYPDVNEGIVNCSFIYSQEEWEHAMKDCPAQYSMLNKPYHEIIR